VPPPKEASALIGDQLAATELFRELPPAVLDRFAARCAMARREAGEMLYDPVGDPPDRVFVIVSGEVDVLWTDGCRDPAPIGSLGPGSLAGEFAALVGRRDGCVLRARTGTSLLVVPRDAFLELVETQSDVVVALLRDIVSVIRCLNGRVASLRSAHEGVARLHRDLLRFVRSCPEAWCANASP
jgi:CRP-like cAMP-binding protein